MYSANSTIWVPHPYGNAAIPEILGDATVLLGQGELRRLAELRQMSFVYPVRPGANVTRLEHSLGAGYLAGKIGEWLRFSREDVNALKLAGVLHDLGHPFWSHTGETLLQELTGKSHESMTLEKLERLKPLLENIVDYAKVRSMLDGSHPYHQIVSHHALSADRLDYIARDRHHVGMPQTDTTGVLPYLWFDGESYGVLYQGLGQAEAVVNSYAFNYMAVYLDEAPTLIATAMLKALYNAIKTDGIDPYEMWNWDDIEAMNTVRHSANPITQSVYKTVFSDNFNQPHLWMVARIKRAVRKFSVRNEELVDDQEYDKLVQSVSSLADRDKTERKVAELTKVDSADVILFTTSGERVKKSADNVAVSYPNGKRDLFEVNPELKQRIDFLASDHDSICLAVGSNSTQNVSELIREKGFVRLLHELEQL
ncbi:MAG: HD domain-containing protein [Candidatus Aenigmarchaeota archaeon]|nr:HD domain-containing protein [Candidatus Aenigmarchaeota archaeon]